MNRSLFSSRPLSLSASFSAIACAALFAATLSACSASPEDMDTTGESSPPIGSVQQEVIKGGGGTGGTTCVDRWQNCYVGCGVRHPEGDMRDGCEDSCDASYRLCKAYGGGGVIMR